MEEDDDKDLEEEQEEQQASAASQHVNVENEKVMTENRKERTNIFRALFPLPLPPCPMRMVDGIFNNIDLLFTEEEVR